MKNSLIKTKHIVIIILITLSLNVHANEIKYPTVGKPCPHFVLNDVINYYRKTIRLEDLKGKWAILDCVNQNLTINNWMSNQLSTFNKIKNKFSSKITILPIAYTGTQYRQFPNDSYPSKSEVKSNFNDLLVDNRYTFPMAIDSIFFNKFDIGPCPYIIVIDPKGIVRAITTYIDLDTFTAIFNGQKPKLYIAYRTHEQGSPFLYYHNDDNFLKVGKPMPNFHFFDLNYYKEKEVNLNEFKGRWLILDCWNRYCESCIKAFPKLDSIQKLLAPKVQVLLVGYTGSQYVPRLGPDNRSMRKLFKAVRSREHLNLPIAYDSTFFKRYDISNCPYQIVIDPKGNVRAITYDVSYHEMLNLITDKSFNLPETYRWHQTKPNAMPSYVDAWYYKNIYPQMYDKKSIIKSGR